MSKFKCFSKFFGISFIHFIHNSRILRLILVVFSDTKTFPCWQDILVVTQFIFSGAPGSQDELYNMAFALDTNEDHSINYQELKKLKRRFRASSFVNNNEFMNQRNEVLPVLQPCSKCKLGLFEPTTRSRIRRYEIFF